MPEEPEEPEILFQFTSRGDDGRELEHAAKEVVETLMKQSPPSRVAESRTGPASACSARAAIGPPGPVNAQRLSGTYACARLA